MFLTTRYPRWCFVFVFSLFVAFTWLAVSAADMSVTSRDIFSNLQEVDVEERPTVGVLFLVDESGGVNGYCPVSEEYVLVTDKRGKRYQIIRFFMALLGSVYDRRFGDARRQSLPHIRTGVAQFADQYERVYDFVPAGDLFVDPFIVDVRSDNLDPCWTDYPTALKEASRELMNLDVDYRVLVIITDGSFRGHELNQDATEDQHTEVRNQVADTFRDHIQARGIQTFVYILGYKSVCYDSLDCGLGNDEYEIRRGDMDRWGEWSNSEDLVRTGYFTLLNANGSEADTIRSIQSIALTPDDTVRSLTPGGRVIEGQITSSGSKNGFEPNFSAPSSLKRQNINIISFQSVSTADTFSLCEPPLDDRQPPLRACIASRPRQGVESLGDYWWRYEREIPPINIPYLCTEQEWDIEYKRNGAIFVWYNAWNREFESVLELEAPDSLVVNNSTHFPLSATVDLSQMPDLLNNSCYHIVFTVDVSDETLDLESEGIQITKSNFNYDFDLPEDLVCPSRMITVGAVIRATDTGADQLPVERQIELRFHPEMGDYEVIVLPFTNPPVEGKPTHVITIPIQYAAPVCNSGFTPVFTFTSSSDEVVARAGCPDNADLTPQLDHDSTRYEMTAQTRGDTVDYILTLKAGPDGTTYISCGYDRITVEIGDGQRSVSLPPTRTPLRVPRWLVCLLLASAIAVIATFASVFIKNRHWRGE